MTKPVEGKVEGTPVLPDQDQRGLIVNELDRNILVEAAAGTGKTTSMIDRMVALLGSGRCPDNRGLVAVTFTRKAAAELRSRFQVSLESAVREASGEEEENLKRALDHVEQCFMGTIHSFCARLLRERPVEAGVDLAFEEIDEVADMRLRSEAWDEYASRLLVLDPGGIIAELESLGLQPGDFRSAFMRFADYPDVEEWLLGEVDCLMPDAGEALEEMERYVAHMRALLPRLPVDTGNDTLIDEYRRLPRVLSHYTRDELRESSVLMELLSRFDRGINLVQKVWTSEEAFTRDEAKAERARWEGFRESVAGPLGGAWLERRYELALMVMFGAREVYDGLRRERGALNFQDLLMKAAELLGEHPNVREYFAGRFTHLLVDEFQDTDPIQAEVLLLLTAADPEEKDWRRCGPRPGSLFVVGDPKQSIYRFRRADIVIYNEVKRIICQGKGSGKGLQVNLSVNFRSTGDIIGWVNGVFEPRGGDDPGEKMLRFPSVAADESPAYVSLQEGRTGETGGDLAGVHSLTVPGECSNKAMVVEYETDRVARTIRHAVDTGATVPRSAREVRGGRPAHVDYDDFMILTRKLENLGRYSRSLREYGIPHTVTGGSALNRVVELRLLHHCLRAVVRPDDPVAIVAALRSEVFGVSDAALYSFKRAGGRFTYRAEVPPGLDDKEAAAIGDAFSAMNRYREWLAGMPAVAAVEKIVEDTGLMALAAAGPGGDVEAGSLAKAIEILRGARAETLTAAGWVEYLGELVRMEESYDGISARSEERPRVRVLNIHKAKGLEAPVVFLADPYGESPHDVELHIDRSGGRVVGYMAIDRRSEDGWGSTPLARPAGWEALAGEEERFTRAEDLRLRYVAATRAASAMVITQREKRNSSNPWQYFDPHIDQGRELPDPGRQASPHQEISPVSPQEPGRARAAVSESGTVMEKPTYDARAAKEYALEGGALPAAASAPPEETGGRAGGEGEHGVEWGTVIHLLLEVAMENPGADLVETAQAALLENDLEAGLAGEAAGTVRSVMDSEIWKRARGSDRRFTEVPFQVPLEEGTPVPTVLRGSIDLVFEEEDGWVLVDYKTDTVAGTTPQRLLERYAPQLEVYADAWERCTGEKVKEKALYLVREDLLLPLPTSPA